MTTAERIHALRRHGLEDQVIAAILGVDPMDVVAFNRDPSVVPGLPSGGSEPVGAQQFIGSTDVPLAAGFDITGDAALQPAAFYRDRDRVFLVGLIHKAAGQTIDVDHLWDFPAGFRPPSYVLITLWVQKHDYTAFWPVLFQFYPNGDVTTASSSNAQYSEVEPAEAYLALDGISFLAEPLA